MSDRILIKDNISCADEHVSGGLPVVCPRHRVILTHHRSTEGYTVEVDGESITMSYEVFRALARLIDAVRE